MAKVYDFDEQLKEGKKGESFLDKFFASKGVKVTPSTIEEERNGNYDRHFVFGGKKAKVEYKTDYMGHKTGNSVIETVSVDTQNKKGWLYTTEADTIAFYTPGNKTIITVLVSALRSAMQGWLQSGKYTEREISKNKTYSSKAVIVKTDDLKKIATKVYTDTGDY